MIETWLTKTFSIKYPIIQAPMFLISDTKMLIAAADAGIMGCAPALNWRSPELFESALKELKAECKGPFGINLIVNKSNIKLKRQLELCAKYKPDFIITSLGSPEETIKICKPEGIKVFCDVVDLAYAIKCEKLGADAVIAVNSGAGGHAGPLPPSILIPMIKKNCKIPVISAGGVGTGAGLLSVLVVGSVGVSIGSPFIASSEAPIGEGYKQACVEFGANDIALTTKLSGTPCTVIKTPYVKKIGTEQNFVEAYLNKNKQVKKWVKGLTFLKGMKMLENAAFSSTYKTVWCAGPSIEFVDKIKSTKEIVDDLISEYQACFNQLNQLKVKEVLHTEEARV